MRTSKKKQRLTHKPAGTNGTADKTNRQVKRPRIASLGIIPHHGFAGRRFRNRKNNIKFFKKFRKRRPVPGRIMYKKVDVPWTYRILRTSDLQRIGYTERSAQRIFEAIRKEDAKPKHAPVTVKDFIKYSRFDEDILKALLGW